jgi:superfamily II DNA or RNA helicase
MKVTPREYQSIAVRAAVKALRAVHMALVVMATGLGKTYTAAFISQRFSPRKTLFLVHNNFILQHAAGEFRDVFGEKTSMALYNGLSKNGAEDAKIVFATWQTMRDNLKRWRRDHFDLVIVDEAHHAEADTYRPVLKYFTGAKLGITATPDREDDANIRDVFGPEVVNITLEEAIARGWLPRIEYHVVTDESLDEDALQEIAVEIREGKKRFTMAEVNRRIFIRKRDEEIARIINGYNEKAVVFCNNIPHAERFVSSLNLADTFHSSKGKSQKDTWDKNQAVLNALKNGTTRRVCAVNAFNEGVNVPSVGLVAFCRVTGSLTIFRQQLGRGLRPGKDKLIVLDFVGNLERIQLVLELMNQISDLHEKYTPKKEIEREGYVRQRFEVSGKGFEFTFSDKVVDLMKVLEHCEREFYPTWQEAAKAAKRLGISSSEEYSLRYKEDERLPSRLTKIYPDFPGFPEFFGRKPNYYKTWEEAAQAARKLGIYSSKQYIKHYKEDPRLVATPIKKYNLTGWLEFFNKQPLYETRQEALRAARRLGIESSKRYLKLHKDDPKLPSNPVRTYGLSSWNEFFGVTVEEPYNTWQEAAKAAQRLGISSSIDYSSKRKKDPRLPADPYNKYKDFPGWNEFLKKSSFYPTWQEASKAIKNLRITSRKEYNERYSEDPQLPRNLYSKYPDFPGWPRKEK